MTLRECIALLALYAVVISCALLIIAEKQTPGSTYGFHYVAWSAAAIFIISFGVFLIYSIANYAKDVIVHRAKKSTLYQEALEKIGDRLPAELHNTLGKNAGKHIRISISRKKVKACSRRSSEKFYLKEVSLTPEDIKISQSVVHKVFKEAFGPLKSFLLRQYGTQIDIPALSYHQILQLAAQSKATKPLQ